jgi:TP901 family phage tail tape measure protein
MASALTATLRADITQFERAIQQAETRITGLQRSTTQVNRELAKFGNDFGGATLIRQANSMAKAVEDIGGVTKLTTAEQKRLSGTVDEALAKYRALGQEVPPALVKVTAALEQIRKAEEEAQRGAEALRTAQKRAADEQAKSLQDAARAQQQLATNLNTIGSGLTRAGAVLTAAVTAPIVAGFGLSIKAAKDFESAFANVVKTVDGLDVDSFGKLNVEAQKLSAEIRDLAKEIPVAATELSAIASIGGQFGVSRENLGAFTETVAKLGVAVDGIEAEEAAAAIAQISKVAGLAEGDFERLASAIVDLGNSGNSTEAEILELSKRFAGAGAAAGLSAAEIAGISAAIANVGINAEAGGTAISKTFNDIGAAVARGGAELEAFARIAGKSSTEFAQIFKDDAVKAIDLFIGGLRRARDAGTDLTVLLDSVNIKEVRQSDTLRRLAGDYENFSKTVDQSREAFEKNTALAEEARKKFATFENQLQLFQYRLTDIGIELGGPLLEGLRGVLDAVDPVVDAAADAARAFNSMSDEGKKATVALVGAVGLAPAMLLVAGQTLQAVSSVLEFSKALRGIQAAQAASQVTQAASAVGGLGAASAGTAASLVGRAGLVGALSALGVVAIEVSKTMEDQIADWTKDIGGATTALGGFIGEWNVLSSTVKNSSASLAAPFLFLVDNYDKLIEIGRTFGQIKIPGFGSAPEAVPDPSLPPPPGRRTTDINLPSNGLPSEEELLARLGVLPRSATDPVFANLTEKIKSLQAAVEDLSPATRAQIDHLRQWGATNKEVAEEIGVAVEVIDAYQKAAKRSSAETKKLAAETNVTSEAFAKFANEGVKSVEQQLKKIGALDVAGKFDDLDKAEKALIARTRQLKDALDLRSETQGLSKEFAGLVRDTKAFTREIEDLQDEADKADPSLRGMYDRLIQLKRADFAGSIEEGVVQTAEFRQVLQAVNPALAEMVRLSGETGAAQAEAVKKTVDWSDGLGSLGDAFSNLAQIGGDAFGGIAQQIGEVIALMDIGAKAGKQFSDAFSKIDEATGKRKFDFSALGGGQGASAAVSAYTNVATTAVASYGALDQATNVKGRGNRAARGAATGAAIGNSIVPGYGALVGAAVGALVGAFRNPAFEDVYKRVAHNFGVELSDETAKAIAQVAKNAFKGDRGAAEIFSLDSIIAEGGGLKDGNIDKLTRRLRDAFSLKEVGKFSADQLTEVLNKNFGAFADFVGRSTEIAGKGFAELAQLAKAAGVDIESINAFVGQQTARVGGGLVDLAGPLAEQAAAFAEAKARVGDLAGASEASFASQAGDVEKYTRELDEAEDVVNSLRKARDLVNVGGSPDFRSDAEALADANKELRDAEDLYDRIKNSRDRAQADQASAAAIGQQVADVAPTVDLSKAQAEFDRLGIIAVGAFNAARSAGLGYLEAVDQISPGLDRMSTIQEQLGLTGNAAFAELSKFRGLVSGNETLVASAEALNETILALSNIGGLTVETLAALEGQGLQTFDQLTAAGFSSGQSIEIMRGFIENLKLAHEQLGEPIGANTQALIDQADALAGLAPKSPTEALTKGFDNVVTAVNRLAKGLGIDVPEAADAAASAVEASLNRSATAATSSAETIAKKGGEAFVEFERRASESYAGVSDRIREAAERGTVYFKNLAGAGGEAFDELGVKASESLGRGISSDEATRQLSTFVSEANDELGKVERDVDIRFHFSQSGELPSGEAFAELERAAAEASLGVSETIREAAERGINGAAEVIATKGGEAFIEFERQASASSAVMGASIREAAEIGIDGASEVIATQGGEMWEIFSRQASDSQVSVSDRIRQAAERGINSYKNLASVGGEAFIELERKAAKSSAGVSDKIREAAERGINAYGRFAGIAEESSEDASQSLQQYWHDFARIQEESLRDAEAGFREFVDSANGELSKIEREVDIRFRYSQSGELPPSGDPYGGGFGEVPGLASGGIVRARAGGTIVRVGEGGQDEAVIPLPNGPGQGVSLPMLVAALSKIQFTGTLEGGGRPLLRYVSREVGDYIQTRTGQRVPI